MAEDITTKRIIENLYTGLLGRSATDAEVMPYIEEIEKGLSLSTAAESIANSHEAQAFRISRSIDRFNLQDIAGLESRHLLSLPSTDLMSTIARFYELFTGRVPFYQEVTKNYQALVDGERLADVLDGIANSEEANKYRDRRQDNIHEPRESFSQFIRAVYLTCLRRPISEEEIGIWHDNHVSKGGSHREIFLGIAGSSEAKSVREGGALSDWNHGLFVQLVYELLLGRGAAPSEIEHHRRALNAGTTSRQDILYNFFTHAGRVATEPQEARTNDPTQAHLPGRSKLLSIGEWRERGIALAASVPEDDVKFTRFLFSSTQTPLVSIITSLFRGGSFIEAFLENITSQTIFEKHCELLIIDADSPEGEFEKAARFLARFSNIKYMRQARRVGIYEAWNIGVSNARGAYCTNANLDDCRRADSFEIQASTLDALPFVDVTYQDVLYSFEANMSFDEIARYGFRTDLPLVSRYNLLEFNSPHNGPMWRKRLHDEIGLFNADYRSAGDFDFWMRCALAGKTFYKIIDAHVAYYVNPQGLSTRSDTPGAAESNQITKLFNRKLIDPDFIMEDDRFSQKLADLASGPVDGITRYAKVQAALRKVSAASRLPETGTP